MSRIVQATAESILRAARNHPEAEKVLQTLFPTAFDSILSVSDTSHTKNGIEVSLATYIQVRVSGDYKNRGIFLPFYMNGIKVKWEIVKDNEGASVLIAKLHESSCK